LDFDLGLGEEKRLAGSDASKSEMAETPLLPEPAVVDTGALDFDLAAESAVIPPTSSSSAVDATVLGLDFNLPDISPAATAEEGENGGIADLDFDLGFETSTESLSATTEVSPVPTGDSGAIPEIALVDDEGVEFDVNLTESTFLGRSIPDPSNFDMSSIDLDLNEPELPISVSGHTVEKAGAAADSDSFDTPFDNVQVATAVNPDFATEQTETIVSPQFDGVQVATAVNPDFATEQSETIVSPQFGIEQEPVAGKEFSAAQAETVVNPQFGDEQDLLPEFDISANEEVTTKLDLAKAYEEMGDFEGARELLQEVLKEGDAAQRENAQTILAKIGD
jgi:pilus assembly protein FimV